MSSGSIRIIQLPEKSSVNTNDYMAVDSSDNGTKKVKFTDLLDSNLSAQNKAADASATGEAISVISDRVDNMINIQQNASVTTLWGGILTRVGQSVTLSEDISNFDFIDVYSGGVDTIFARRPVRSSGVYFSLQTQNMSDDASEQYMHWYETGLTISGTTATITKAVKCDWNNFSAKPIVSQATDGAVDIIHIDGVKIGHIENAEITDARIGADGVTYPNLGDAIRTQVTDLKNFILGEVGETNDEIVDARVGADDVTYPTLGDAIRGQVTDLKNFILGEVGEVDETVEQNTQDIKMLSAQASTFCDELEVDEEGLVWLLHEGERIAGPYGPFAGGGGGGGGGNNAKITVTNTTGWLSKTIAEGTACQISVNWSSVEDDIPTGDGVLTVKVNGSTRLNQNIAQGNISFDIAPYLVSGQNLIRVNIADVYGNNRSINYIVTLMSLSIRSSFDATTAKSGAFTFSYIPVGNVAKNVKFYVDDTLIGTEETSVSGRQLDYTIPAQPHGSHTLLVYFTSEVDGETVKSNELFYDVICIDSESTVPIIASTFRTDTAEQYTTLNIPYSAYDPNGLTTEVTMLANGEQVSKQIVDRTVHTWSYRADAVGELTLALKVGSVTKSFVLNITESTIDAKVTTDAMVLSLQSAGRSNNEEHPDTWVYEDIECVFTDFNHKSDGWLLDENGSTVLRVSGDARLEIPYKPFAEDFRTKGKTIEIDFATRDVLNYDASILSCTSDGRGLRLTAQGATLTSEQSSIFTQYKENEHVRLSFVVEKRTENRLLYVYLNGVMCGAIQYPDSDDFSQTTPVNISIGSNYCTMDIYSIRIYDNDLTRTQMLENWIADTQSIDTMLARYGHNNVYDKYGNIVIAKLPTDLPYMIITAPVLPQYKGDKKTVSVEYVDPQSKARSFTAENVQADVQGTSSQYYARKNYKLKYKGGFKLGTGETVSKYAMRSDSVPTNTFTMKADVASSEGANNVELARLYDSVCPYKTPPQIENESVRQGIDGFPIVIFWNDGTNTQFVGKYNFNNDKGTEEVFGFVSGDESWEIKNNTSDRVIWKNDDYTGTDWLNDFEARYPDTDPAYTDSRQLAEFASWVKSTDTTAATGDPIEPVTYGEVEYTTDSAEYRLAKFKAEAENYMELESAMFYYLFTELFLMVDSRAKNAFPSFMGGTMNE